MSTSFVLAHPRFNILNVEMDESTLGKRIKIARKLGEGMTQEQLAHAIGAAGQSTVGNYERDVNIPDVPTIKKIAEATGAPLFWLIGEANNAERGAQQEPGNYAITDDKYAFIPKYSAAAGAGGVNDNGHEEISGTHAYRRDWLERRKLHPAMCVVIDVVGDSMAPTINDGDVVLINRGERKVKSGQVYVFQIDEGARLKRLYRQMDGRVRVSSDNPDKIAYPDEWLTPGMEASIIGIVVHRSGSV